VVTEAALTSEQLSNSELLVDVEAASSDCPCTSYGEMQKLVSMTSSRLWLPKSDVSVKVRMRQSHGK